MVKHNERSAKGALPSWPAPADAQFDIPNVSMGPIVFKQSAAVQNQRGHSAAAAASLASGASGTPCVERWRGPVVDFSLHHLTFWYTLQCCSYGRTNHPRPLSCLRLDGATPEWRIDLFTSRIFAQGQLYVLASRVTVGGGNSSPRLVCVCRAAKTFFKIRYCYRTDPRNFELDWRRTMSCCRSRHGIRDCS